MKKETAQKVYQINLSDGNINCYGKEQFFKAAEIVYYAIKNEIISFKGEAKVYKELQELENVKVFDKIENKFDKMSDFEVVNKITDDDISIITRMAKTAIKTAKAIKIPEKISEKELQEAKEMALAGGMEEDDFDQMVEAFEDEDEDEDEDIKKLVKKSVKKPVIPAKTNTKESQQEQVKCEKCGTLNVLDPDQKFCTDCGEVLRGKESKKEQTKKYKKLQNEKENLKKNVKRIKEIKYLSDNEIIENLYARYEEAHNNAVSDKEKTRKNKTSKQLDTIIDFIALIKENLKSLEDWQERIEQIDEQLDGDAFQLEMQTDEPKEIKTDLAEAVTA